MEPGARGPLRKPWLEGDPRSQALVALVPGCMVTLQLRGLEWTLWDGSAAMGQAEIPEVAHKGPMPSL